ncbi:MAG TPA: cyclase family protein [Gaiellaceae bacterium]|jgi:kynurenine formamidase
MQHVHSPTVERWWPSAFGEHDEHGMLNHVTDAKRRAALASVREGRIFDLGRVLDERVPVFPGRAFHQTLVTTAHHANMGGVGENEVNWITEVISGTTQLGTHLDALSHLQIGDRAYNGRRVSEIAQAGGVTALGIETVPPIVTRGWLVDVAPLGAGDVIRPDDVGIEPEPGDAVLFHTGWGEYWDEAATYLAGEPGPGLELAAWLAERGVALTGCDTWSYGPVPAEDPKRPFEVPQTLNVKHGVFVVENLETSELAAAGVREFALVLTFPKLRGATGAWCSPIAIV